MRLKARAVAAGALLVGLFAARPASADEAGRNPAVAQALYEEGRRLVDAGQFAEACPKFKQSYDLDPGGGTLLNLADCYEKLGKTALAWSTFKEALVMAERDGRGSRAEYAREHIASLEARLSTLSIQPAAAARVPGFTVSLDGTPFGEAAWGVAVPIDPGKHVVRAEAPGKRAFEREIEIAAAGRQTLEIPALEDAAAASSPAPTAPAGDEPPKDRAAEDSSLGDIGWMVGGVGLVSVGVGSFFGLRAFSKWSERNDACEGGCTEAAERAGDQAGTAATISTVGFGVGVVAIGVGTFLVLSSGSSAEKPPGASLKGLSVAVGRDRAALSLGGAW